MAEVSIGRDLVADLITFTPAGGIAATDVQAALEELDTEKAGAGEWGAGTEKTIAAGIATLAGAGRYTIDTQDDAPTDDLTQILGLADGNVAIFSPADGARTIVVKNGANILLESGADFTMNNVNDTMCVMCLGGNICKELWRGNTGA